MNSQLLDQWPKGPDGAPEEAVLLLRDGDYASYAGITLSLLESCGIPCLTRRSGTGQIGFIYGGFSQEGVDIYVPASRLEEARQLLTTTADDAVAE